MSLSIENHPTFLLRTDHVLFDMPINTVLNQLALLAKLLPELFKDRAAWVLIKYTWGGDQKSALFSHLHRENQEGILRLAGRAPPGSEREGSVSLFSDTLLAPVLKVLEACLAAPVGQLKHNSIHLSLHPKFSA